MWLRTYLLKSSAWVNRKYYVYSQSKIPKCINVKSYLSERTKKITFKPGILIFLMNNMKIKN